MTMADVSFKKAFTFAELIVLTIIMLCGFTIYLPRMKRLKEDQLQGTCFERGHNLALAINMYAGANDARLPLALSYDTKNRRYRSNEPASYPAPWLIETGPRLIAENLAVWVNSTLPYAIDDKNFFCPSTEIIHLPGLMYRISRPLPAAMTYTYNGLLHQLPVSEVADRSQTIVVWEGMGCTSLNGFAFSSPMLDCETGVCNSETVKTAHLFRPLRTMLVHKQSFTAVYLDERAAAIEVGSDKDPFIYEGVAGRAEAYWTENGVPPMFRSKPGGPGKRTRTEFKPFRFPAQLGQ